MRTVTLILDGTTVQTVELADTLSAEETRSAVQQVLDVAARSPGGGTVQLSQGIFVVAAGADAGDGALRVGSNTVFEGAGQGLTSIRLADNPGHDVTGIVRTDSGKTAPDGTPIATHNVVIRDLSIDGNKANTGTALVDGFFCGPKPITETAIDSNIRLENVEISNVSRYGFDPHERTDNLVFVNCVAHDNAQDGFTIDFCTNVTLTNCEAYANGRHGVNIVTSTYGVTIDNLNSHDNGATGLTVQTGNFETRALSGGVTVTGGSITGNGGDGIVVRQAVEVTIGGTLPGEGVTVTNNGRFGVLVEGGRGVALLGNTISANAADTGSDDTDVRIRGYLQTHLDNDALNDVFVRSANVTIAGNTIGSVAGDVHDYGVSFSDTDELVLTSNVLSYLVMASIEDTSKQGSSALFVESVTSGNDSIQGTEGSDSIAAGTGNDYVNGLSGNDKLYGGDGNDTLEGGDGADILTGGFGDDVFIIDAFDTIAEAAQGGNDEIRTTSLTLALAAYANVECLTFIGTGNFNGTGNTGDNVIKGGAGDDTLDGGAGNDTLDGGAGNDTYVVDAAGDSISDSSGVDTVKASLSVTLTGTLDNLVLMGSGNLAGTGNALANALTGNAGANALSGGDGNDRLDGGAGADTLTGGNGDDTFVVDNAGDTASDAAGTDIVFASLSFTLAEAIEALHLTGTAAINGTGNSMSNTLRGNSAGNLLTGLDGNDFLDGGAGRDMLSGGNGNDTFYVDRSDDVIVDSSGLDRVSASANFTLGSSLEQLFLSGTSAIDGTGNGLANTLYGNAAANKLSGLAGNDFISAGAGHDTILGGAGNDRLSGGAGFDRFVFNTALSATTNVDRISDYSAADDTFAVAKSVFSAFASLGTLHAGQFYKGTSAHDADDRIIYNATNGALIYDSNGNTTGGATMFAILATGLTLTHADFTVI